MPGPGSIAIDGPAGSGKSTIGEQLAQRLGYLYVDTGAMYRALTWLALHENVPITDGPALGKLAQQADIAIHHPNVADGRQYTVTVNGKDITWDIRSPAVTRAVSAVSAHPEVRTVLRARQHALGERVPVVMVGRDIGAVVLPEARWKFYLTASLEERARRRRKELLKRTSKHTVPSLEEVMSDIGRRDENDRENMQPASDAIMIDTNALSIPQVVAVIEQYLEKKHETGDQRGLR